MRQAASIFLLTLLLVSCVSNEIEITMIPHGDSPNFRFKYVKGKRTVHLADLTIKEAESGLIVWQIRTFDPSLIFEERDGRRMPKKPRDIDYSKLKTVPIRQVTFGVVPEGFNQYDPPNNDKPTLRSEVKYLISAGGGTGGKTEFTLEKECRKISVTSFSINDPDFTKPNAC